jgi:hypothetical protein
MCLGRFDKALSGKEISCLSENFKSVTLYTEPRHASESRPYPDVLFLYRTSFSTKVGHVQAFLMSCVCYVAHKFDSPLCARPDSPRYVDPLT